MIKSITNKNVLVATLVSVLYFAFLYSNYHFFKFKHVLIGVVQEIITIPILFLQFFLFFLAAKFSIRDKFSFQKTSVYSFIILIFLLFFLWTSFFNQK